MNKISFIFASVCCLIPFLCEGQATTSLRSWREGPLQWREFQGDPGDKPANCFITWEEQTKRVQEGRLIWVWSSWHAYFHPELSYVQPGMATDEELRKQQTLFDQYEKFARIYGDSIRVNPAEKKLLRNEVMRCCLTEVEEGALNPDTAALNKPDFNPTAHKWKTGWGYSGRIGLSYWTTVNRPDGFWRDALLLSLSGALEYRRHALELSFSISSTSIAIPEWRRKMNDIWMGAAAYRYAFYNGDSFRLSAYAGGGYGKVIGYNMGLVSDTYHDVTQGVILTEGVMAEYRIISYMLFNQRTPERLDVRAFAKIGANQMLADRLDCLTFDIGLCIASHSLRHSQ